ncbi:MAG: hypothetical protein ACREQ9_21010, partial [Candidatus Binatia bacterium]
MAERPIGGIRAALGRMAAAGAALIAGTLVTPADATFRYGPVQLSGNLETQQLIRVDKRNGDHFQALNPVQQRNTFRLQYEH